MAGEPLIARAAVTGCIDCPLMHWDECMEGLSGECTHPEVEYFRPKITPNFAPPDDCPLRTHELHVGLVTD